MRMKKSLYLFSLFVLLLASFAHCADDYDAEETTTTTTTLSNDISGDTTTTTTTTINTNLKSDDSPTTAEGNDIATDESTTTTTTTTISTTTAASDEESTTSTVEEDTTTTTEETTTEETTTEETTTEETTTEETTTEEASTTTTEESTTSNDDEETSTTAVADVESSDESTTSSTTVEDTTVSEDETTTESTTSTTSQEPSLNSLLEKTVNELDHEIGENDEDKYEIIDVTRSLNAPTKLTIDRIRPATSQQIYEVKHIRSLDANLQIQLNIGLNKNSTNPISFKHCILSTVDAPDKVIANKSGNCLQTYGQIHKSDFYLIVKRWLVTEPIEISFRVVISGCNMSSNVREINYNPNKPLPNIVHQSDHECTYRIRNVNERSHMLMSTLLSYPEEHECHTYVRIASSSLPKDINGQTHLMFDSLDSTLPFSHGVLVAKEYVMIKMANCKRNIQPIVLRVTSLPKKSFKMIDFSKPDSLNNEVLDSAQLMPNKEENFLAEIVNDNSRDLIKVKLTKYAIHDQAECSENFKTSILTIFALNEQNALKIKQYDCDSSKMFETLSFKGYKRVFIQFYRVSHQESGKEIGFDQFEMNVEHVKVKKFFEVLQTPNKYITSESRNSSDLTNSQFDFQIKAPKNHRIVLEVEKFTNGQPIFLIDCLNNRNFKDLSECLRKCDDDAYLLIKMNYSLGRNQLTPTAAYQTDLVNPKECNILNGKRTYYSHSNVLIISMVYSTPADRSQYVNKENPIKPSFNFTFRFEPVCNNVYTSLKKDQLPFDSSRSVSNYQEPTNTCSNTIMTSNVRKIVLYKTNWFGNNLFKSEKSDSEPSDSVTNGNLICRHLDSFSISDISPKYRNKQANLQSNVYCQKNLFNSYASKTNVLYLSYNKQTNQSMESENSEEKIVDQLKEAKEKEEYDLSMRNLVFEYGYFTYKYLYTNTDRRMVVDFAEIIPENINPDVVVDSLDFKIKAPENFYIVPTIRDCRLMNLTTGKLFINAIERSIECKNQSFLLFGGTSVQEIEFKFTNVNLTELVMNKIGFTVDYEMDLRVKKDLKGSLSSQDFTRLKPLNKQDTITYEWLIDVDPNYYVRLNIERLENIEIVENLAFIDAETNTMLYDKRSITPTFTKLSLKNYVLSTNKLLVSFKFKPTEGTSFVNITYSCEPRSILLSERNPSGEISLSSSLQNTLMWTITAPKDYVIQVKVTDYLRKSRQSEKADSQTQNQLIFSYLSKSYSHDGIYFFDFKHYEADSDDIYNRPTDIVISKENIMHIQYTTKGISDSFKLSYSMIRKVYTEPSGLITQYYNDLVVPVLFVPKLTEQMWIIRAPYGKQIKIDKLFVDLVAEESCSKALVSIQEQNGSVLANLCGSFDKSLEKRESSILVSQSNEITIKFTTQERNDVVYRRESSDIKNPKTLYRGFRLAYSFVETSGDCSFQTLKPGFCDYQELSSTSTRSNRDPIWLISSSSSSLSNLNSLKSPMKLDEQSKEVLTNRFVKAVLKDSDPIESALISPVIKRSKRFFKFEYTFDGPLNSANNDYKFQVLLLKVSNSTQLDAKEIRKLAESAIMRKDLNLTTRSGSNKIVLLKSVDEDVALTSKIVSLPVGNYLYSDYRVMFLLTKMSAKSLNKPITVTLDNIQSIDYDIDCNELTRSRYGSLISTADEWNLVEDTCENGILQASAAIQTNDCQKYVSPCSVSPCSPIGTLLCLNKPFFVVQSPLNPSDYTCHCKYGFTGRFCEQKIDPCNSVEFNKCTNNSTCESNLTSNDPDEFMKFKCKCKLNFVGKYCEENVSPCKRKSNMCNQLTKQGICVDKATESEPDKFECECDPAFSGENCEKRLVSIDVCSDDRCNKEDKDARCVKNVCLCSNGFEGEKCTRINRCAINNPCKNNGTCNSKENSLTCECKKGYSGRFCEKGTICSECNKNGTWFCDFGLKNTTQGVEQWIDPKCVCHKTHMGRLCDKPRETCTPARCGKNGYCISDKVSEPKCVCNEGFTGKFCERDEKVCDMGYCLNGAKCIPNDNIKISKSQIIDSFKCTCTDDFTGKFCEKPIDKCEKLSPCKNGGTCHKLVMSNSSKSDYMCECPTTHTGKNCETKVDFCAKNKCPYDSECIPLENDYKCKCQNNKFGRHCEFKPDKCRENACVHGRCIEQNEYVLEVTNSSLPYKCQCHTGYTGEFCDRPIEACASSPCLNGAECVNLLNGYKCICPRDHTGDNCQDKISLCSYPPTQCVFEHNLNCTNGYGTYKCGCTEGYTGARCETKIDVCELTRPCFSGKCVVNPQNISDYKCVDCMPGYTGKNCETLIDYCADLKPCQNGGLCYSKPDDYHCSCPEEFTGKNCATRLVKECLFNKCKNNSACERKKNYNDKGDKYECKCDDKHHGTYCEKERTLCDKIDCPHGVCDPKTGKCVCNPLFPSEFCKESTLCDKVKCLNGGRCVRVVLDSSNAEAKCLCPPGLTGKSCEKSIYCDKEINGNVCGDNAVECVTMGRDGYQCKCKPDFAGPFCNVTKVFQAERSMMEIKKKKDMEDKQRCSFGNSKQSKAFMAIASVSLIIFALIGFLVAHCSIRSYKDKLNKLERANSTSAFSLIHTNQQFDANNNKMSNSSTKSTMISSSSGVPKSPDSFTIPRPSIYPTLRN